MKRHIIVAAVATAALVLMACDANTDVDNPSQAPTSVIETAPVSIPSNEIHEEVANETQHGNTSGNIIC